MYAKIVALSAFIAAAAAGGYSPPAYNLPNVPNVPNHPNVPNVPNVPNHPNPNPNNNGQNPPVSGNKCNVGEMQCCNSVQSADSDAVQKVLSTVGITAGSVTGMVGLTCNPIDVIAVGGNSCNAQPVCCENNSFNGLVALGCSPINANL